MRSGGAEQQNSPVLGCHKELSVVKKLDYGLLVRNASISVVKEILKQIAVEGLFRKQQIYITFAPGHPDVVVSDLLREDFGDEMTIVLQYEFWDLVVDDFGFSVSLAFEHSDETLYIPFASLVSVSDPSEDFTLDFTPNFAEVHQKPRKGEGDQIAAKTAGKVISLDAFRTK